MQFKNSLENFLRKEWVDKAIAVGLVAYSIHLTFASIHEKRGLPLIWLLVSATIYNVLTLFRQKPYRITVSPFYWTIALAARYSFLLYGLVRDNPSIALVPTTLTNSLTIVSAGLALWARVSLGRSFGVVPADRGIITRGAYRFVRHPLYGAEFVGVISFILAYFSWDRFVLVLLQTSLTVWKAVLEEKFLSGNETYRQYLNLVRYRFFPLVA